MKFNSTWRHLAAVQVGGAVCLPIFVVGHAMALEYGLVSALVGVAAGNLVLLLLGLAAANFSAKTRMTTTEAAAFAFGEAGAPYFALTLIVSLIGWFAIQLDMMGMMAGQLLGIGAAPGLNLAIGVGITLAALKGYKGLEALASVCLPLMAFTIAYALWNASSEPLTLKMESDISMGAAAIAMAAAIGAVIDMPTYFREAKTTKDGLLAATLLFGFALPLLEGIGIYLAAHGQGDNLVDVLVGSSPSVLWRIWAALFILIAGWTTNNANLYSAGVSFKTLFKVKSEAKAQVVLGLLATALSMFHLQDHLFLFLEVLGVLLASAGGVMLVNHFDYGSLSRTGNLIALLMGLLGGSLACIGIQVSGMPMVDALLISGGVATAFKVAAAKNSKDKECYEICRNR